MLLISAIEFEEIELYVQPVEWLIVRLIDA